MGAFGGIDADFDGVVDDAFDGDQDLHDGCVCCFVVEVALMLSEVDRWNVERWASTSLSLLFRC